MTRVICPEYLIHRRRFNSAYFKIQYETILYVIHRPQTVVARLHPSLVEGRNYGERSFLSEIQRFNRERAVPSDMLSTPNTNLNPRVDASLL